MNRDNAEREATPRSSPAPCWRKAWQRLLVTAGLRSHPRHESVRRNTLAFAVAVLFALGGTALRFNWSDRLGDAPLDLDLAYRAVSHGWFASDQTQPVTLVDIDERTYRGWGLPPFTPREPLRQMLEVVTAAGPRAVVVDIDLSWGDLATEQADPTAQGLRRFLQQYRGSAVLVFPKRIDNSSSAERRAVPSPLDDVFAASDRLVWAHANVATGGGGAVRSWPDWLAVCTATGAEWLPSVTVRVLQAVSAGSQAPLEAPSSRPDCAAADEPSIAAQRLLIGPGLGPDAAPKPDARVVSAAHLLDPEIARDDAALFRDRVVFIGATHPGSGDFWLTPSGVRPGVEMVANAVRYAPVQRGGETVAARLGYRALSLFLFAMFVVLERKLRGIVATTLTLLGALVTIAVTMTFTQSLAVFDALEAAVLLVILYKALDVIGETIAEIRTTRSKFGRGVGGWKDTVVALCRRES